MALLQVGDGCEARGVAREDAARYDWKTHTKRKDNYLFGTSTSVRTTYVDVLHV